MVVCFQGAYGENCSQKCGGNCARNRTCNPVDGSCGDCAEGYDGVKCDVIKSNFQSQFEKINEMNVGHWG